MKKIFSLAIVLCAAAMISCGGNTTKKASDAEAAEATRTEAAACSECTEKCDSTACCCEKAEGACCEQNDSTKCDKAECESACCNKK